jgi:hypothetical protein
LKELAMDYGSKVLEDLIVIFENMTDEEYLDLHEKAKALEESFDRDIL